MKERFIRVKVELDDNSLPQQIWWEAEDTSDKGLCATRSISFSVWDEEMKNTLRLDLWTPDMGITQMKKFHIDCLASAAKTLRDATGDTQMANEIEGLCERLTLRLQIGHEPEVKG